MPPVVRKTKRIIKRVEFLGMEEDRDELSFKGNDPGAVRFGNFINYYKFHSPEARIKPLDDYGWESHAQDEHLIALDIGCNSGDLTAAIHSFLSRRLCDSSIKILGIDIDRTLITRASEKSTTGIAYMCLDIMSKDAAEKLQEHLLKNGKHKFDIVFCFSITMWIHLNFGDEGLFTFLRNVCEKSNFIVIEPQPWKCYQTAVRRLKKSGHSFPFYPKLTNRSTIETTIINTIISNRFKIVHETTSTDWERKVLFFSRVS